MPPVTQMTHGDQPQGPDNQLQEDAMKEVTPDALVTCGLRDNGQSQRPK